MKNSSLAIIETGSLFTVPSHVLERQTRADHHADWPRLMQRLGDAGMKSYGGCTIERCCQRADDHFQ